jgi:hypothetical protein
LLAKKVTFYRTSLPSYASVIHPGGAPDWLLRRWIESLKGVEGIGTPPEEDTTTPKPSIAAIPKPIEDDIQRFAITSPSVDDPLVAFLDLLDAEPAHEIRDVTYPI